MSVFFLGFVILLGIEKLIILKFLIPALMSWLYREMMTAENSCFFIILFFPLLRYNNEFGRQSINFRLFTNSLNYFCQVLSERFFHRYDNISMKKS